MPRQYSDFTETERKILRIAQKNLPDSAAPYADIAAQVGVSEDEVLELLREMLNNGSIRRFGASIKHQRAGYAYNAMVAWAVKNREEADEAAKEIVGHSLISHCYYRPSCAPDWPYEFFTMIHGRHDCEYKEVIEFILQHTGLREYAVLESLRELKKISMAYF